MDRVKPLEVRAGALVFASVLICALWQNRTAALALLAAFGLHEAAHAAMGYLLGCKTRKLILGMCPYVAMDNPHSARKDALIALAGPLANLIMFLVFGFNLWGLAAAANLMVVMVTVVPLPGSDCRRMWAAIHP